MNRTSSSVSTWAAPPRRPLVQDGEVTIDTDYWLESSANEEGYP